MSNYTYDEPLRTPHVISGTPTAALTKLVAVPFGATRFRLKSLTAALQAGNNASENAIEVGVPGDVGKFSNGLSLAVTAAAPTDRHEKDLSANDVTDEPALLLTVGADAGAEGDTVEYTFVIDWF